MALTRAAIESIAQLARLELKRGRIPVYQDKFEPHPRFCRGNWSAPLRTTSHQWRIHWAGLSQRLRADVVTEEDAHQRYQENAPQVAAGLYLVPKVIE